jgi:hypothetical protein
VVDNRFQARDLLGRGGADESPFGTIAAFVASVFILNLGLPSWFGTFAAALGFDLVTTEGINRLEGDAILGLVTAGGQTQFRGNQVRLDLTRSDQDVVLANVFVACLDDAVISDNQTEGIFSVFSVDLRPPEVIVHSHYPAAGFTRFAPDLLLADLYNLALTTRQTDNGLMTTPLLTMFSILSRGIVNHCTHNQTTSCILAFGSSPKSVEEGNAVLYPNPSFCPERD